jgi:hypothetical protein
MLRIGTQNAKWQSEHVTSFRQARQARVDDAIPNYSVNLLKAENYTYFMVHGAYVQIL